MVTERGIPTREEAIDWSRLGGCGFRSDVVGWRSSRFCVSIRRSEGGELARKHGISEAVLCDWEGHVRLLERPSLTCRERNRIRREQALHRRAVRPCAIDGHQVVEAAT